MATNSPLATGTYFCPDCGKKLVWDTSGAKVESLISINRPAWYCPRSICGWVDIEGLFPALQV